MDLCRRSAKAMENREQDYAKRRSRYIVEILRNEDAGKIVDKESR